VGVLLLAKQCGLLPAIRPELDALRADAGFWLGDSVYQLALQKARESS
jgi:predicted nucleic acid-binding protein